MSVLFSVVIPSFNRRALLPHTLASAWSQTYTSYEIIVIDDGSTDGTLEYLSVVTKPIHVIHQPNLGPGAARNAGIAAAKGDYVAFLDSDDLWYPWTLATMSTLIRTYASPALIAGRVKQFTDVAETADVKERPVQGLRFDDFLASAQRPLLIGSGTVIIRRDVAVASGGFTTRRINGEDIDLILRLGVVAGFVSVTAPITMAWRRHPESETHNMGESVEGVNYLVQQERAGRYPGGRERTGERRDVITRHVRPVSFACLRSNAVQSGLSLYAATFLWHVQLGRWRYLLVFPLAAFWASVRSVAVLLRTK